MPSLTKSDFCGILSSLRCWVQVAVSPGGMGIPSTSAAKETACNAGDPGLIPGLGSSPGEGIGYPLQYSCLENPPGQRSLAGYNPRKESDMTE